MKVIDVDLFAALHESKNGTERPREHVRFPGRRWPTRWCYGLTSLCRCRRCFRHLVWLIRCQSSTVRVGTHVSVCNRLVTLLPLIHPTLGSTRLVNSTQSPSQ